MPARSLILVLLALLLGACTNSPEKARAKAVRARAHAQRKAQETYDPDREGDWERVQDYRDARRDTAEQLTEAKRESADAARDRADALAEDKAAKKDAQRDLKEE